MCRRRAVVAVAATWLLWGCGGKTDSTPDEGTGIADSGDLSFADPDGGDASGDGSADACKPSCDGLQCGDDGCGGTCGACSGAQDQCLAGKCVCQPDCVGKSCGDDGCGGTCGDCVGDQMACQEGACICQPDCVGKACGPDGCNGVCGACPGAQDQCEAGACVCKAACAGKNCGADGCGGTCGECAGAQDQCLEGVCTCIPACEGKKCGEDGCGAVCGLCPDGDACFDGACCTPQCEGKECGDDQCGSVCGTCPGKQDVCEAGVCICIPACQGKVCGDDGCGGSCGSCADDDVCYVGACCTPDCTGNVCGDDLCGGYCGNGAAVTEGCPAFQECVGDPLLCQLYAAPDLCGQKQCGANGIGGVCGMCPCADCSPAATKCEEFKCVVPEGLECWEIFDCFGGCPAGNQACFSSCVNEGTVAAQIQYNAFISCLDLVGYFDCPQGDEQCQETLIEKCMDPYYECFHGDEPCFVLYVCLTACPGGDSNCTNACFTSATIEALKTWDQFISCLEGAGYYDCPPADATCKDAALELCDPELSACLNGPLDCYEVFGCIQACEWWDNVCRIGCRVLATSAVDEAIDAIATCVEQNCEPVTGLCEQEVLIDECSAEYAACLAL